LLILVHRDCAALSERIRRLEAAIFPAEESELIHRVSSSGKPNVHLDEEQERTSEWLEDLLTDPNRSITKPPAV
jgi:hypothetical protein